MHSLSYSQAKVIKKINYTRKVPVIIGGGGYGRHCPISELNQYHGDASLVISVLLNFL